MASVRTGKSSNPPGSRAKQTSAAMSHAATTSGAAAAVAGGRTDDLDEQQRNFSFRMSKKVAELTQVIHILFVHNHEKEVKLAAMEAAYERELDRITADAERMLDAAEKQLREAQEAGTLQQQEFEKRVEEALATNNQTWRVKVQTLEERLSTSSNGLTDEVVRMREQNDQLVAESHAHRKNLADTSRDLERLKNKLHQAEQSRDSAVTKCNHLDMELVELKLRLAEAETARENLSTRNRRLEDELSNLQRHQSRQQHTLRLTHRQQRETSSSSSDELERLRQEVRHLKMELGNREMNFNRVFTPHQPVYLSHNNPTNSKQRTDMMTSFNTVDVTVKSLTHTPSFAQQNMYGLSNGGEIRTNDASTATKQPAWGAAQSVTPSHRSAVMFTDEESSNLISQETETISRLARDVSQQSHVSTTTSSADSNCSHSLPPVLIDSRSSRLHHKGTRNSATVATPSFQVREPVAIAADRSDHVRRSPLMRPLPLSSRHSHITCGESYDETGTVYVETEVRSENG